MLGGAGTGTGQIVRWAMAAGALLLVAIMLYSIAWASLMGSCSEGEAFVLMQSKCV
jgi:hypothetical protein